MQINLTVIALAVDLNMNVNNESFPSKTNDDVMNN